MPDSPKKELDDDVMTIEDLVVLKNTIPLVPEDIRLDPQLERRIRSDIRQALSFRRLIQH